MKTYRVALNVGGVVFVQADRHEQVETMIRFYRGETITAEYACTNVKEEIYEAPPTERIGLFAPKGQGLRRND